MPDEPPPPSLTNVWFSLAPFFVDAIGGRNPLACVMRRARLFRFQCRLLLTLSVVLFWGQPATRAAETEFSSSLVVVSNIAQLQQLTARASQVSCDFQLTGDVWFCNVEQGRIVLRDDSGAAALELNLATKYPEFGARIHLTGRAVVEHRGSVLRLGGKGAVVDNDGVHAMIEKHGAVYLEAGKQPIRVEWFNGLERAGLELEISGPGLARQRIPDAMLVRREATNDSEGWASGLDVRYFAVNGSVLPEFEKLPVLSAGVVSNFTLANRPQAEWIGAVFTGYLDVLTAGVYRFHLKSDDGGRLFVGGPTLQFVKFGTAPIPAARRLSVGQVLGPEDSAVWAEVEGRVTLVRQTSGGMVFELAAGAGQMRVEVGDAHGVNPAVLQNARVRVTGFCQSALSTDGQRVANNLLVPDAGHIQLVDEFSAPTAERTRGGAGNAPPLLTTAAAVHGLKRDEAQRALPVRLRGVVTCVLPEHQAFTMQDATRGIYVVDATASLPTPPRIGEFLEVEGSTDPSLFAPIVNARYVVARGTGRLPEPIKPTWDQLVNGSLDAQPVELEGIVTAVQTNGLTLLTRGGVIKVELRLNGEGLDGLARYENARVRIRGCLFASWDYVTHQVKMGDVRIYAADIIVAEPAPVDLFSSPSKTAGELLLFDPLAGVFQRVKVSGQIVHERDGEYYLVDGARGLRFMPKQPVMLARGDLVDVVGFPDLLGSASPVLREAVVRKRGQAALPPARDLASDDLINADHDATRVLVEGTLVNQRRAKSATILEMQNGVRTFIARVTDRAETMPSLAVGSRLELTGVYAGLGGNRAAGQDISAFELLLHSPTDIEVLARPPWWTLKRLLYIVGALAAVLAGAMLWIKQLHRQVEERTTELAAQIQERQRVEQQRALEEERTRIAQDLHDELGSGITEMSMLAARAKSAASSNNKRGSYLDEVGGKARELVTALDEIVWAMNPRHDSFSSLVSYFSLYADRFLGLANIAWRLEQPGAQPDRPIDSRRRHQLFLAFKEALTNVVRHSSATEVCISIRCEGERLLMSVADNGRGLPSDARTENMDGVVNMRGRIEKLGGEFKIDGASGRGTTVRFDVPAKYES